MKEGAFLRVQKEHFRLAEERRFEWMTKNELIRRCEHDLLEKVRTYARPDARFLEVGCGEGANLFNAGVKSPSRMKVGLDFSADKVLYWRDRVRAEPSFGENSFGVCADAARIPFREGSFDFVFCRDVIHHIPTRLQEDVAKEMVRVCRSGGVVLFVEANGKNPIIWAHARLLPEESGELTISPGFLRDLLKKANGGTEPVTQMYEPLPISRIAVHYRFGLPSLARHWWARRAFHALDRLAARIVPEDRWAYVTLMVQKVSQS